MRFFFYIFVYYFYINVDIFSLYSNFCLILLFFANPTTNLFQNLILYLTLHSEHIFIQFGLIVMPMVITITITTVIIMIMFVIMVMFMIMIMIMGMVMILFLMVIQLPDSLNDRI